MVLVVFIDLYFILISIYAYYLDLLLWLIICVICCFICARNWAFMRYTMLEVAGSMHCWFCKKNTQISNVFQHPPTVYWHIYSNVLQRPPSDLPTSSNVFPTSIWSTSSSTWTTWTLEDVGIWALGPLVDVGRRWNVYQRRFQRPSTAFQRPPMSGRRWNAMCVL